MITKNCSWCKQDIDINLFSNFKASKDGKQSRCKACAKSTKKQWDIENAEYIIEKGRWDGKRTAYGITKDEYFRMVELQDNKCKICGLSGELNKHGHLYVDHCHTQGVIRGLLCKECNILLGNCRDNTWILENAIKYLEDTK